jgi:ectoine hydroxylase-related dioxygenase (phytanoyl-CoA dioxygenase family)
MKTLTRQMQKNGALKIILKPHLRGVYKPETIDWNTETETICNVEKGSIMIMKPLLLHCSGRTTNIINEAFYI